MHALKRKTNSLKKAELSVKRLFKKMGKRSHYLSMFLSMSSLLKKAGLRREIFTNTRLETQALMVSNELQILYNQLNEKYDKFNDEK